MSNRRNVAQNHQKTLDRMRKKMIENKGGQKICLILLIKDQTDNINNLLTSVKFVVNMISIIDLSNNNDTIEFIIDWCKNNNIPIKINTDNFKDIAFNKTNSIKISKLAFPDSDYFLLSELDFIWTVNDFDKEILTKDKYDIIDNNNYQCTRLLSSKINWLCHLNTHEYWTAINDKSYSNGNLSTSLSININDNKYQEKISLLREELKNNNLPKFDKLRVKFYLGLMLKNVNSFEEAIIYSKERMMEGGCKEEIYYSTYNVGMSYEKWGWRMKKCIEIKEDPEYIKKWNPNNLTDEELLLETVKLFKQALFYYKKAYDSHPTRSESLYSSAKLYRKLAINEMFILAYQTIMIGKKIKCSSDYLFVNKACYDYLFDYELIMIAYLFPDKKLEGKEAIGRLLNREDIPIKIKQNILSKMEYY